MTVADLMREDVVSAARDTPVAEVATAMRNEDVGSVVVAENGAPVGLVTDRDVAVRVAADRLDAGEMDAESVMTEDPITVEHDTGVFELCATMAEESVRRVPIVNGGDLVGIVTMDDLTLLLSDELGNLAGVIEAESPPFAERPA
jgi:CBS domain-containing protein